MQHIWGNIHRNVVRVAQYWDVSLGSYFSMSSVKALHEVVWFGSVLFFALLSGVSRLVCALTARNILIFN